MEREVYQQLPLELRNELAPAPLHSVEIPKEPCVTLSKRTIIYVPTRKGSYARVTLMSEMQGKKLPGQKAAGLPAYETQEKALVYKGEHQSFWWIAKGVKIGSFSQLAKKR